MFEALSGKLTAALQRMVSKGRLTEKEVDETMREVRLALLEADVNFRVVRDLVARIRERVLDEEVFKSLSPGQQVIKITNEELTTILGGGARHLIPASRSPSVLLITGLNGSGKTTTAAKLARHLMNLGQRPMLVAGDLQRPAAVQQLESLGKEIEVEVYQDSTSRDVVEVAREGVKHAKALKAAWAVVDTAGRFQTDDGLMSELEKLKAAVSPAETLLVVDAMTGQDAVRVAREFHSRVGLTGLILTKLDGDARGGAALSIVSVTGIPVKFIGTGERLNALEQFYPDRLASRILGMGDMLTLIEKAQTTFNENQAAQLEKKIRQATFDLEDFLGQLNQLKNMGPLSQILEMIPGMSSIKGNLPTDDLGDDQIKKVEAMIRSMTIAERQTPEIIGGSRRRRIAKGSGTTPRDINQLLNKFRQMQKLMQQMASGKSLGGFGRMLRQ